MAKMGRPKKDKVKDKSIGVRLPEECYEQLMLYVSEHKLTITQVVQEALEMYFQKS